MKLSLLILAASVTCSLAGEYSDRFFELYNIINDPKNGYYSVEGIPYHSRETLIVESIDYGHETDSEALSFNLYLQAVYGALSGDFQKFQVAWDLIENYTVPLVQPNSDKYNPLEPAGADGITVGADPIYDELVSAYGDTGIFGSHWLLDVDNVFGFGNVQGQCLAGPSVQGPSLINNGQGTVWQSITYPTCDNFNYGGEFGFSFYETVPYYTYSIAPDCDSRVVQVGLWASRWASEQGKLDQIQPTLSKVSRVGDYLRYALFDKHFKKIGDCIGKTDCPAGTGKESAHYLLSWSIGWGGSLDTENGYSWRSGNSEAHVGYQNPVAAFALATEPSLKPASPSAVEDWEASTHRQVELYQWLQSDEGPIAGGVTNSFNNEYDEPPADIKSYTFHGMYYAVQPGYEGSSDQLIFQAWTIDRLAQYYYLSGDEVAQAVLDKWMNWFYTQIQIEDTYYSVPSYFTWVGNVPNQHASVSQAGENIGVATATSRAMSYYAAKSGDLRAKEYAKGLLDIIWKLNRDEYGISMTTTSTSYDGFNTKLYIPVDGWSGVYPNGYQLNASASFLDIRPWFQKDPSWPQVEDYLNGGPAPQFNYHRFNEQSDLAVSFGTYAILFNE